MSVVPAITMIGATASSKKAGDNTNVLACMIQLQCAAKHHVSPDCEILAGTPIAGQRMNAAEVP